VSPPPQKSKLDTILSYLNLFHIVTIYFCQIHFNIIASSTFFPLATESRPAPCPPSLLRNGYRGSFDGDKAAGCETDHSPTSNAKVRNTWSYVSTPPILLHSVVLSKAHGKI